jgi:hypothetical protein
MLSHCEVQVGDGEGSVGGVNSNVRQFESLLGSVGGARVNPVVIGGCHKQISEQSVHCSFAERHRKQNCTRTVRNYVGQQKCAYRQLAPALDEEGATALANLRHCARILPEHANLLSPYSRVYESNERIGSGWVRHAHSRSSLQLPAGRPP